MSAPQIPVILIGGPPGAGKSTLGRALASHLGYSSLTADDLLVAEGALTTEESHPAFHLMSEIGHVRYFTEMPVEKLIADALGQEEAMWKVIERVIRSHVNNGAPVVIDWWLLRPVSVADLDEDRLCSVWLHIDPDALWTRERANTDWMKASSAPDRMLANFMHRSLWRNDLVFTEAADLGLPLLDLTGDESVEDLVERVVGMLEP